MDENKRASMKHAKLATELCIIAVAAIMGTYFAGKALRNTKDVTRPPIVESAIDNEIGETTEPVEIDSKIIYENIDVETKSKFRGEMILVNNDTQYFTGNEELVNINQQLNADGCDIFVANDNNMQVCKPMVSSLEKLLNDFYLATNINDVVIISGYRTQDKQQQLYDDDLKKTGLDYSELVAKPGFSEHQTGYAVDFTTETTWDYDGQGDYKWIDENCWKYGLILRYPEDKISLTKIKYEPWHYRYVGKCHAYFMYTNKMCMEEYMKLLKGYTYEGNHLAITDGDGEEYEVYFVPSDDGSETTSVPVPANADYDISGNNEDGFIVTVHVDAQTSITEIADSTEAAETAETTEEVTEAE